MGELPKNKAARPVAFVKLRDFRFKPSSDRRIGMVDKPWLDSASNDFGTAFPNVEAIDFTIDDNPWGWYDVRGARPLRYTSATATAFVACPNDRCRRGGFDFGRFLMNNTFGLKITTIDESYPCSGDEGSPAGRKTGSPCMNSFKVQGSITYKAAGDN